MIATLGLLGAAPALASGKAPAPIASSEGGPVFLRLERIVVPVFANGAVAKHLTIILVLELADAQARDKAKELLPRLTDAFVNDLHRLASRPDAIDGIDMALAKRQLLASGTRVLGPDSVKGVLIERTISRRTS